MPFELFIALRYLLTRRTSLLSTIGVAVGVMALVIALALMTGLQGEMRDRILGATAHVYVWVTGGIRDYQAEVQRLRQVDGVIGAGPVILDRALIVTDRGRQFINLKGVDPLLEQDVTDIERAMLRGRLEDLVDGSEDLPPGILLGRQLAQQLGVDIGGRVTLITPSGTLSPMGIMTRPRTVRVVGIYSLGFLEFDAEYGVISLDFAMRLLGKEAPDLIELRVADIYEAPAISTRIMEQFGSTYVAEDWADMNETWFSALWLEKMVISITIGLIVLVAALNIIASLIMLVMEKRRDIAILKTMGTTSRRVTAIFMLQGLIIGLVGTAIGAMLGYTLSWFLDRYRLIQLPMEVYQVAYVPFVVQRQDFAVVVIASIAICFLATIYPSRQAARLDPVQALRFE
ncbi:MAG: FtsX-like permease family protein [Vicinamibacterales bacterium]